MIRLMGRVLAVSGRFKGRILAAFIFSFFHAMLSKAPVGLAFLALSAFLYGKMTEELCLWLGIGLALCVLLEYLCQNAADRLQAAAGYMVFAEKRMELGNHLRRLPMGYFTEGNIGKISSVLSTDMVFIEENCMHDIANMMSNVFAQVIMILFLAVLNPWLAAAGGAIALLICLMGKHALAGTMAHSDVRQEQSERLTRAVLDYIEGIGIIKAYNILGEKSRELSDNFRESCRTSIAFEESQAPWMRWHFGVCGAGAAALLALALVIYGQGGLSAGFLLGFLLFVMDLFGPVKALYGESPRLTVMNSCMDRIEAVFEEKELPDDGTDAFPGEYDGPEVEFKEVCFAYGEKEVLHKISFAIEKNRMAALVGPSGGGKSTIASLLTRFWDVKSGEILIRGKDIRNIPLGELMEHISVVFQRVYLFHDTVYNNIAMGRPDAGREEVMEAARKARCYDFIMQLPDGFDTVIEEGGGSLSGGERQRISIARCILKDAPIIVLDEATASVDADNESFIQEAITELCRGKTLLVIAHRLNTIQYADPILVVAGGRIVQSGTHWELSGQDGVYRRFMEAQERGQGWNTKEE